MRYPCTSDRPKKSIFYCCDTIRKTIMNSARPIHTSTPAPVAPVEQNIYIQQHQQLPPQPPPPQPQIHAQPPIYYYPQAPPPPYYQDNFRFYYIPTPQYRYCEPRYCEPRYCEPPPTRYCEPPPTRYCEPPSEPSNYCRYR
jgi:hypothetical protein